VKPLVVCVDRDDDIGQKALIKGPIIGRAPNLEAAQKLALADPADTDVNALYGAIKLADELGTEVVTLTGVGHVGVISDKEIARQLDEILSKLKPVSIIFVSDGLDDEQVMPIIQSRVKIDSVQTITVRQSKELEKAYFKLTNFIKEVTGDPALARLIFGLPGIALLLLAVGGAQALSWIMGVVGIYLIVKGFGWEDELFNTASDFLKSLSVERMSTVLYLLAVLLGLYAMFDLERSSLSFTDSSILLNTLSLFIRNSNSVNMLFAALFIAISARVKDEWTVKRFIHVRRYFLLAGIISLVYILLDAGANYFSIENYSVRDFATRGLIAVAALGVWIKLTELFFKAEIRVIEKIMRETEGKEVTDAEGRKYGKVTKAVVENFELKEIRMGRKAIPRKEIISIGDTIIVKKEESSFSAIPQISNAIKAFKFPGPQSFPRLPDFTYRGKKRPAAQEPEKK
jgi:putative membrane protein